MGEWQRCKRDGAVALHELKSRGFFETGTCVNYIGGGLKDGNHGNERESPS